MLQKLRLVKLPQLPLQKNKFYLKTDRKMPLKKGIFGL